jgi:hypothetical protein
VKKEVISNLKRENQFLSTDISESVGSISREREICKLVLKLDFTAHGITESLSEFGLWWEREGSQKLAVNLKNESIKRSKLRF